MTYPVSYDITRLVTRILNSTPNGIDRVDLAYAKYFLSQSGGIVSGMMHFGALGHRSISATPARRLTDSIFEHFREETKENSTFTIDAFKWLDGGESRPRFEKSKQPNLLRYFAVANFYLRSGGTFGSDPVKSLPPHTRYLCVSQYPLSEPSAYRWLNKRPDIKAIFFVHDMLPVQFPEYFKPRELGRHIQRLNNVATYAAGVLVSTQHVKAQLIDTMKQLGRPTLPIHVSPIPLAPAFLKNHEITLLQRKPYFISCGTIEPRKNHLLLLNIWRELSLELGANTPKLVLVGARGWENENILDMLDRSPSIKEHVLELNGLSTPDLIQLMRGASALLMPSFGEGFGLPVAEAMALDLPVIASDISVFREIANDFTTLVSPIDGLGWKRVIRRMLDETSNVRHRPAVSKRSLPCLDMTVLDEFVQSL